MKTIITFFKNLHLKNFFNSTIKVAIKTLEILKNITDSPITDVVVALTFTKIDDAILTILRKSIPTALMTIQTGIEIEACLGNIDDNLKINCIIDSVRKLSKTDQGKYYLAIAKEIVKEKTKGRIDISDNDLEYIINGTYQNMKLHNKL